MYPSLAHAQRVRNDQTAPSQQLAVSLLLPGLASVAVLDSFGGAQWRRSVVALGTFFMALTLADVDHVATLARLGLSDDERERMRDQLSIILDHISELSLLDTDAISPTASVAQLTNVWRQDVVRPSFTADEVFRNAPRSADDCFVVRTPLGGEGEAS